MNLSPLRSLNFGALARREMQRKLLIGLKNTTVTSRVIFGRTLPILRQESKESPCHGHDKLAHVRISPEWRWRPLAASFALFRWHSTDPVKFACYLAAALLASSLKVSLPGIEGTMSMNFLLTLLCILELGLPETLAIGLIRTLAQAYWKPARQPKLVQLVFNLSQVTVCNAAAYGAYRVVSQHVVHGPGSSGFAGGGGHALCLRHGRDGSHHRADGRQVHPEGVERSYLWLFPYYMVGAAVAGFVSFLNQQIGWQAALLILPPIYLMYRSYRLYLGKLEAEKQHAEKVSSLHLRTIESLALAIEAKDQTTGEHLQRVRVYAMELARDLGLTEDETEALRAAPCFTILESWPCQSTSFPSPASSRRKSSRR